MLHSFYGGVENIFKRIVLELDDTLPGGEAWHNELLAQMTRATEARPAVISVALAARLREYLKFRHVFRSLYAYMLSWERMEPLVLGCEETLRMFEQELDRWLEEAGRRYGG